MSNDALRPTSWEAFVGQDKLKGRLKLHINAAIDRDDLLDHLLLVGPPGSGKTSLARLVSKELQCDFQTFVMPIKLKMLIKALTDFEGALFLDEIHRMSKKEQEFLLPVLEDHFIQLDNGARQPLAGQVTIIGATTEPEKVIKPLYDRFVIKPQFEEYTNEQMAEIVRRMAKRIGLHPSDEECLALGRASAGVPRQARTIVFTARDLESTNPTDVLRVCGITADGLTEMHILYLEAMHSLGMLAGIDLMVNYLRVPKELVLETERLLVRKRYIEYTAKGRQLTSAGLKIIQNHK